MRGVRGRSREREASWRSGYAEDCKSLHPGSIPGEASNDFRCRRAVSFVCDAPMSCASRRIILGRAELLADAFQIEPTMLFSATPPVMTTDRARRLERLVAKVSRVGDEKLAEVERAVVIVVG